MTRMITALWHDEAGFVVSAELILVATIVVLSLIVGLAEVANGVNEELEDVGSAVSSVNQSFTFPGLTNGKGTKIGASVFYDAADFCDSQFDIGSYNGNSNESPRSGY